MKPRVDLRILLATEDDVPVVGDHLKNYFFPEEPLNCSLGRNPQTSEIPFSKTLAEQMSFKAVDVLSESKDNVAGIVLNTEVKFGEPEHGATSNCPKFLKIAKILNEVDKKSKIWEKVNNETHMDIKVVTVNTKYRGLKVGQKLMEESLNLARSRNYKYVSVTCTSFYSARIAQEMGFETIYEMPYEQYLNEDGEPVFKVRPPHVAIKKMLKTL